MAIDVKLSLEEELSRKDWGNNYILESDKYDDYLDTLVPSKMQGDKSWDAVNEIYRRSGNGANYRKFINDVFGKLNNENMKDWHYISLINNPSDNLGSQLDAIGNNLKLSREPSEADDDYRIRLELVILSRSAFTSIPSITESLKVVFGDDTINLIENPNGEIASIAVQSNNSSTNFGNLVEAVKSLTPAGVFIAPAGLVLELWQDVKDDFAHWQEVNDNEYW